MRKITAAGIVVTVAGTGAAGYNSDNIAATSAKLNWPVGVALDRAGNLFIAENGGHRVRRCDAVSGAPFAVACCLPVLPVFRKRDSFASTQRR